MPCANTEPENCRTFDAIFDKIKALQTLEKNRCRQNIAALTKCKKEIEDLFSEETMAGSCSSPEESRL